MLIHSWRWFGPADRITLEQIVQTGARNIVTALHEIPVGETWSSGAIRERRQLIEHSGMEWSVVESVPVHEDIKMRTGDFLATIENYKQTLMNLGQEGITTVCYNFMPALDWSRTELKVRFKDGTESTCFHFAHFAAIDMFILKRRGAQATYPPEVLRDAETFFNQLDQSAIEKLRDTFLLGFPGSGETFTLEQVLERIRGYEGIDKATFRSNLAFFIREIVPVAEKAGVRLAIHPDDPPWPLMGMPRVFSTLEDAAFITQVVDSPFNGLTFCTGSLGASHANDLGLMAEKLAHRINFAHLRNVSRDEHHNFQEEHFFSGDVDMYRIMKILVLEDIRRRREAGDRAGIPVRPDHGARLLGDFQETYYPGYSLYGRLKNLAEIRGLEIGIRNSLEEAQVHALNQTLKKLL